MSEVTSTKKHLSATDEISGILGFKNVSGGHADLASHVSAENNPANLPVVDSHAVDSGSSVSHAKPVLDFGAQGHVDTLEESLAKQPAWKKVLKAALPYFAVFFVGLALYYFFLSNTDFSSILDKLKPAPKVVQTSKETALQSIEKQNLSAYNTWIAQYYFDVSDASIIDPNVDNSGNGLSNFQKFLLGLNPRSYDTLGLGEADSQSLAAGINPLSGSPLNDKQKAIVDKYFDMEVIMNRLTLSNLKNSRNVAGAVINNNQQNSNNNNNNNNNNANNQNSGGLNVLGNQPNYNNNNSAGGGSAFGGNYNNNAGGVAQNNNSFVAPKTGADVNKANIFANSSDIDQTRPGLLEIPSLKISVPLVWTQDPKNFDTDLQSGVVHYPGTALPGQIGTTYISGHSSNYAWAKGSYNRVFSKLGDLADNSSFSITVYTKTGKTIKYHYVVTRRAEYKATDQAQFNNAGTPVVALSTCWPVNTTQKRLVVFGEQTQIEQ